jgi:hypothetical protein
VTTVRIEIGSATADEAHAFVAAYQRTRKRGELPAHREAPTVRIAGPWSWHVTTPNISPERAAAMVAILWPPVRSTGRAIDRHDDALAAMAEVIDVDRCTPEVAAELVCGRGIGTASPAVLVRLWPVWRALAAADDGVTGGV